MSTNFCEKCKLEHPGRVCDFKEGDCAETNAGNITLETLQDAFAQTLEPTLYQLSEEADHHHGDPGDEDDSQRLSD